MTRYRYPAYVELAPNRYRERFGLDFEDFAPGQVFKHRPGYTFTQQDNIDDSLDTLNQAMLHYDEHYAAQTEFQRPLVVTTIIVQKLMGMGWKTFYRRKAISQWNAIDMLAPVYGGDTLYAESEILAVSEGAGPAAPGSDSLFPGAGSECGQVTVRCRGLKPDGAKVCEMEYECLVYKRGCLPFEQLGY